MHYESTVVEIGERLAFESAEAVLEKADLFCENERDRIELANRPQIAALREEGSHLLTEEKELRERLRNAPQPGELAMRKRKIFYYSAITLVLTAASVAFVFYSFAPFGLGWVAYLYALGAAVGAPFLIEFTLKHWNGEKVLKAIAAVSCLAAIAGLMLLAVVRGQILAQRLTSAEPTVIIDDDPQTAAPQPQNDFYANTMRLLLPVMVLLAFAMDLGAGLALHEAWRIASSDTEDWDALRSRLKELDDKKTALVTAFTQLQEEPALFFKTFWSNFHRATLTHAARRAMMKAAIVAFGLSLLLGVRANAETRLNLVIAVDLSQSVAVHAPGQPSEFQKNIDGVTRVLAQAPAGSRVTIIGITDQSFALPRILLSAKIPDDAGYFGERLASARRQVIQAWKRRSQNLQPLFPHTDIIGALFLAKQELDAKTASEKVLVIFSDMRNSTRELSVDEPSKVAYFSRALQHGKVPVADLQGIDAYVMGSNSACRSVGYWYQLRDSWTLYFKDAGANMRSYTVLRETDGLLFQR